MDTFVCGFFFILIYGSHAESSTIPPTLSNTTMPNANESSYPIVSTTTKNSKTSTQQQDGTIMSTETTTDMTNTATVANNTSVNTTTTIQDSNETIVSTVSLIEMTTSSSKDNDTFNETTQISHTTHSKNGTEQEEIQTMNMFYIIIAAVTGSAVGFGVVVTVIVFVVVKKRSASSLGKRYRVDDRASTTSIINSQYDPHNNLIEQELEGKSDGNQNYHMIDEQNFHKSGSFTKNGPNDGVLNTAYDVDTPDMVKSMQRSESNKSIQSKKSETHKGNKGETNKSSSNIRHQYTQVFKRERTIDKGDFQLDPSRQPSITTPTKNDRIVEKKDSKELELEKSEKETNLVLTSIKTNGVDDEDDEVYTNAFSQPINDVATSNNSCVEALRNVVSSTNANGVYEFALPTEDGCTMVCEKENTNEKKNEKDTLGEVDEDHYEPTEFEKVGNTDDRIEDDIIYHNEDKTEDTIYQNDDEDLKMKSTHFDDDDAYDCAMSTISHTNSHDDIYDTTLENDYDLTQNESQKRRFIIRSTDDNYDHCELPVEPENYDLVVLQDEL